VIDARAMVTAEHVLNTLEAANRADRQLNIRQGKKSPPTGKRANYAPESTENSRRLSLSRLPDFSALHRVRDRQVAPSSRLSVSVAASERLGRRQSRALIGPRRLGDRHCNLSLPRISRRTAFVRQATIRCEIVLHADGA